jgi:hypothetical protein
MIELQERIFMVVSSETAALLFAVHITLISLLCEEGPHASEGVAFREENALRRGDDCPGERVSFTPV